MSTVLQSALSSELDEQITFHKRPSFNTYTGTSGDDALAGTYWDDHLLGGAADDTLDGHSGSDTLIGGAGVDTLTGGETYGYGVKFVFTSLTDSYANAQGSHSDLITSFSEYDVLDLTTLHLERIGNGHNGDLAVSYDAASDITYLRSLDKDASGNFFEVRLAGDYQGKLSTSNFVLRNDGTAGNDTLYSLSTKQYVLNGLDGDDTLYAGKTGSVLDGGAGADHLIGNTNAETFLYHQISDSFVNDASGVASVDLISDFNLFRGDVLDVSALGFTGLGDGYDGTLNYAYDKTLGHIVVQSFEADAQGNRFEVYIDQSNRHGSIAYQDADGFIFAGDNSHDDADQTLTGKPGWDSLHTQDAGGVLIGGGAGDALTGGSGVDTFRYLDSSDSVHGAADLIKNFDVAHDKIDVAALGYTGLGDGTNGTLKLVYDKELHHTYLKDYDLNADGQRFEIGLVGTFTKTFTADNLIVAGTVSTAEHATVELVGVAPADNHLVG
ncbi:M10 family metallopeptidase C-terminal domain-containing protein [Pseudomonas syringae]|uniref:M10 family metallopeptidase C-terminal domain-containing protein n=1 Tax=Pseudomonas syringae TaxID=317 RepID=UPI000CD36D4E|nr:calcium-binding protein [Pseudomonas syringae]MCF5199294.1 calcium-binding protein [Pseudomonas syringae]MCF5207725.1 calcium-binding protein [Pseudomonas syringae]MCF5215988.1 calcium-binding protein [Pseudomonas syringae]MCF5217346.1 calcium-binding protein [Pseudomonas syringae]MCF5266036.1 calcium-binding protein [Pseudomonas syringae]